MKYFVLIFLMLSGCSVNIEKPPEVKTIYVTTPLELPRKPELIKVSSSDLECVTDSAKQKLLQRDAALKTYIQDLETVILSTRKTP